MANAQPEPSMDEILASIRRIISEDDDQAPRRRQRLDTLQLGESEAVVSDRADDVVDPVAPVVDAAPVPPARVVTRAAVRSVDVHEEPAVSKPAIDLVSAASAAVASEAFGVLQQNVRISGASGRTMEDIVEAMLQPMVRDWLDANLPRIVEEKVEEEVRRIARRR